jgi:membrane protein
MKFRISSQIKEIYSVIYTAVKHFWIDDCYTKSSVLTFYTLQSLVPFLALLIAVAKGFGLDHYVVNQMIDFFHQQKESLEIATNIAYSALEYTKTGVVLGLGILLIIWANINLLSYVEVTLNYIWRENTTRSFFRKISDYLATIILCPILFVVTSSMTAYLQAEIIHLQEMNPLFHTLGSYFLSLLKVGSWFLSCILFFLLYFLIPNSKKFVWPRIIAALFAGSIFQIWQIIYFKLQIHIFSYNIVYGAFAILPLLLIWLQVSWLIVLAGAEIAATIENRFFYRFKNDRENIKINQRQLGLMIMHEILDSFRSGEHAKTDIQLSQALMVPLVFIRNTLNTLVEGKILSTVRNSDGTIGYNPFRDPSVIKIKNVCDVIDNQEVHDLYVMQSDTLRRTDEVLSQINQAEDTSPGNISLSQF